MAGNSVPQPNFDVLGVKFILIFSPSLNIRGDGLAPASIWNSNDSGCSNAWMLLENLFNVCWGNIFAS